MCSAPPDEAEWQAETDRIAGPDRWYSTAGWKKDYGFKLIGFASQAEAGEMWQIAFAVAGAILSGLTAFSRMTLFTPSPDVQGTEAAHSPIGWQPQDQRR